MEIFYVFAGGAAGSIARYYIGKRISGKAKSPFPSGTFFVNITGALLLGIVSSLPVDKNIYALTAEGFLGAYTTFSTFMYEGFNLIKGRKKLNAFLYISSTVITGIIGFILGKLLAELIVLYI